MPTHLEVLYNLLDNKIQNPVDILPFSAEEKFTQLNFSKMLAVKLGNFELGAKARKVEIDLYYDLNEDKIPEPIENPEMSLNDYFQLYMDNAGQVSVTDEVREETGRRLKNFIENQNLYPDLIEQIANYKYES